MARINEHYAKLPASYLFPEINRRVRAYQTAHPDAQVIRLGIGDVTEPLAPAITAAMHTAVDELGKRETFRGYGPEQGYDFLVEAIREHDYKARGVEIAADEIFVSDGSKCDSGNIQESSRSPQAWRSPTRLSGLRRLERDGGPHAGRRS